jgi:hypothetical protein
MIGTHVLLIKRAIYFCVLSFLCLSFQGCAVNQKSLKKIVQTSAATEIDKYKDEVIKDLKEYKRKLDLRNPYSFSHELQDKIYQEIDAGKNTIQLTYKEKNLVTENEYLFYAFAPEPIKNRNDLLILGLYKLIYKAYDLSNSHKFAALEYNSKYLQELYRYLQVIRWKIRTDKGRNGQYLFLTWQNNWQIELMKSDATDLNIIRELPYIKNQRETLYDHSNFSFENILTRMLVNVRYSLEETNIEPYEMSLSALRTFVFII